MKDLLIWVSDRLFCEITICLMVNVRLCVLVVNCDRDVGLNYLQL